ncbi:hypothetical protein SUGI_0215040 [Cryptomeria japonica]|nr:hypothetical protein SUGI_0215040 [Cryptomeria japonica]
MHSLKTHGRFTTRVKKCLSELRSQFDLMESMGHLFKESPYRNEEDISGLLHLTNAANAEKTTPSKTALSEKVRRQKMNNLLYTLRSKVPKVTKMDKASILSDTIDYIQELTRQIHNIEEEDMNKTAASNTNICVKYVFNTPEDFTALNHVCSSKTNNKKFLVQMTVKAISANATEIQLVRQHHEGESLEMKSSGVFSFVHGATTALESLSLNIVKVTFVREPLECLRFFVIF